MGSVSAGLDLHSRVNKERAKVLDAIWIDNKHEINLQLADLPCEVVKDLMILFSCSVTQLAGSIKNYKEKFK